MKYAIVKDSIVTNIVEWDGESEYTVDGELVQADDKAHVGGTYDGSSFSAPAASADNRTYAEKRAVAYPSVTDFMEAYTEKEIGSDSSKWDAYVIAYNKVRTDNPKP